VSTPASLHLDSGREFRGGQRQVLYLLQGLQKRGQRVLLCCPRQSVLHERAQAAGIPVQPLTLRSGLDFASSVRLVRLVREGGFDLVHAHDAGSHSIALAAQGIGRHPALTDRLVVTRRSVGQAAGRLDRLKYDRDGTLYLAISNAVRDSLLRLGVAPARILVVPSGIELRPPAARRADDPWELAARGLRVVGSVGHLTREKNHALLLDAFARAHKQLPDTHLVLAGEGPLRAALTRRAASLGVAPHVTFAGQVDDVGAVYASMSVFALSSDVEGLCTSLLDAMAMGVPCAVTAVGGVLEIARHGESALVVPPRDADALAGAIVRLLQQPDLAARVVEGGRRVAERYSIDRMVDGTAAAYDRVLATAPDSRPVPPATGARAR